VTASDTSKVPNASPTAASSGSDLNGMAAQDAARKLRTRLAAFAARKFDCDPQVVEFRDGAVHAGQKCLPFAELARSAYFARVPLSFPTYAGILGRVAADAARELEPSSGRLSASTDAIPR